MQRKAARERPSAKEDQVHRAVVSHLAQRAVSDLVYWHTPNGEARAAGIGGKLRAFGHTGGRPLSVVSAREAILSTP